MNETRRRIAELIERGWALNRIARELGLAASTVGYHANRLSAPGPAVARPQRGLPNRLPEPSPALYRPTRERVAELLRQGMSRAEVARRLGVSKPTVSYHARRLGEAIDERCANRYDWSAVQRVYDGGASVSECQRVFGFSRQSWWSAVQRGLLVPRPVGMPLDRLLAANVYRNRLNLKRRLLGAGLKQERCEACGLTEWRGATLSLSLHHVNGDRHDNRLQNLRLLCPNCHSQTDTFSGRNRTPRRRVQSTAG